MKPETRPLPFFAKKADNRTVVVKTGVRAGASENRAKALEEANK